MDDLATLIEPQIPALRRYAFALLRDREAADDLVQDTLERAIRAWPQRRPDGDPRAWLFAILRNLFLSTRRRGRPIAEAAPAALAQVADAAADPEAALRARDVLDLLGGLPEEQRSILLLVAVEDLSYAEAAAVLDVPLGTVMSRLSRARARMRAFLDTGGPASLGGRLRRVK